MDHSAPPLRLTPRLLDLDALAELLPVVRGADPAAALVAEVEGLPRLPVPVLQVLLALRAEGREVRLEGAGEPMLLALATLGLGGAFAVAEAA